MESVSSLADKTATSADRANRFELGVGWYGNYDGYDLAALSMLSQGPPLYLLNTFYSVRSTTVISSLVIDSLATYIPFRLLRPLSLAHAAFNSKSSVAVPNRDVVTDFTVQASITLLAAGIYSVTLYSAYASYLPIYLVTYFEGISSISAAHSATPISLMPLTLLFGLATKSFIFTPSAVAVPSLADAKASAFNPATATLAQTFRYNVWGFSPRTKIVLRRTLTLMLVTGVNTFVQSFVTIEGVEVCLIPLTFLFDIFQYWCIQQLSNYKGALCYAG
jgi:hypothetical protein